MDKHSSLVQKFVNHGQKMFYNIGPWSIEVPTFTANVLLQPLTELTRLAEPLSILLI